MPHWFLLFIPLFFRSSFFLPSDSAVVLSPFIFFFILTSSLRFSLPFIPLCSFSPAYLYIFFFLRHFLSHPSIFSLSLPSFPSFSISNPLSSLFPLMLSLLCILIFVFPFLLLSTFSLPFYILHLYFPPDFIRSCIRPFSTIPIAISRFLPPPLSSLPPFSLASPSL